MKKLMKFTLAAVLTMTAMFAQYRPMDHNGPAGAGQAADPATMIANRVAFLKSLLTLTDAQATQATKIFTDELAAETTLRTSLDTAQTSLRDAIKSNSTATINSLATEIGALHGKQVLADATAEAAFYALLTADQKTKYDTLNGPGAGGGKGFGGGPR